MGDKPFIAFAFCAGTGTSRPRSGSMEYEIPHGEDLLFDPSTNPSLLHRDDEPNARRRPGPHPDPADKRKLQKAELIPEEEEQQLA